MDLTERDKLKYMYNVVRKDKNMREVDDDYFETLTNDEIAGEIAEMIGESEAFDVRDV